jgi:flagellar protein FliO/FliZ
MKKLTTLFFTLFFTLFLSFCTFAQDEPQVGKHVGGTTDAMSMILSLLMVLALIVILGFLLKRFQPARFDNKHLKIITKLQLGTKESLIVVQVGEKQQLLGVTAGQITLLETLDTPIVSQNGLSGADLGQTLVSFLQKTSHKKKQDSNKKAPSDTQVKEESQSVSLLKKHQ